MLGKGNELRICQRRSRRSQVGKNSSVDVTCCPEALKRCKSGWRGKSEGGTCPGKSGAGVKQSSIETPMGGSEPMMVDKS